MDFLIGVDVSERTTTQKFPLGSLAMVKTPTTSDKIYMYVQAGGALAVNTVAVISGGTATVGYSAVAATTTSTAPGAGQGKPVGVPDTAFASGEYGWIQIYGGASVLVLASAAAYTQLNSTATSGTLDDDATAGAEVIEGIALRTANGGATAAAVAILTFPRVGRTL